MTVSSYREEMPELSPHPQFSKLIGRKVTDFHQKQNMKQNMKWYRHAWIQFEKL